jgi:hypothetical protein
MKQDLVVIYAARTLQDAHLLRNLLSDAGIQAVVTNDLLQGGSGVDIVGWPSLSRVAVGAADAPRAREMALEFDRRAVAAAEDGGEVLGDEGPPAEAPPWPKCPQCGAPRTTRCPVCGTTGSRFPAADADPSGVPRRLCSTCDEPFEPEYPRQCEWCGHEFSDGYDVGPTAAPAGDEAALNARAVVLLVGIAVLGVVLAGWLFFTFR